MMAGNDAEAFSAAYCVSRETMGRLETHLDLLCRWNPRINLVSRASLADAWSRHFSDSAQLWRFLPKGARRWVDLGSGAGFPGLVIAALAVEAAATLQIHLVESDQRKAAFLDAVIRGAGLSAVVHPKRIEDVAPLQGDVVSARALAPLTELLAMAETHRRPGGIALFPKGASVHKELAEAAAHWRFDHVLHRSLTDPAAAIVEIGVTYRA
jgi:16S rRNA (guanine527-N7)-methyltransferase